MKLAAAALAAFIAFPAAAADETLMYEHGAWSVSLVDWDDGTLSCRAGSETDDTKMRVWADSWNETLNFQFVASGWDFTPSEGTIFVDIDYQRYEAPATFDGGSIFVTDLSAEFMRHFKRGSAIALFDEYGRRVMTYSLSGTSAVTDALLECWRML
jgi:hypothetical protein